MWVLYKGHDDPSTRLFVFITTMILLLAVITPPLLSYLRVTLLLQDYRAKVRPKGAAEQHRAPQPAGPADPGPARNGQNGPSLGRKHHGQGGGDSSPPGQPSRLACPGPPRTAPPRSRPGDGRWRL